MKKTLIPLVIISAIISYFLLNDNEKQATVQTVSEKTPIQVETMIIGASSATWNFVTTWEVFSAQNTNLIAKTQATINQILVKIWDKVNKWDILVWLKSEQIVSSLNSAKINYSNLLSTYNKSNLSASKNLQNSLTALNSAKTNYENTKKQVELQKNQALQGLNSTKLANKLSISQAQQNLDNATELVQKNESSSRTNLSNALSSAKITISDTLLNLDIILGVEDKHKDEASSIQAELWTLNPSTLETAKSNYRIAKKSFDQTDFTNFQSVTDTLNKVLDSSNANLELLNNSTISSTQQSTLIASTNGLAQAIQSTINSINSASKALETTITSNQASIESAKKALEVAKQQNWEISQSIIWAQSNFDVASQSLNSALDAAKNVLDQAQSAYDSAQEASKVQLAQIKSQVDSAKWQLDSIQISFDDLSIKAPFDWEITNINYELGSEVWPGQSVLSIKNNDSNLKIITYLSKYQITGLTIWDIVQIGQKSQDKISSISSSADDKTKKFKVEILHNNPFLKPWQFIDLSFTKASSNSKIFIPISSVFVVSEWNYVWLNVNNLSKKRLIQIWNINWNDIEITSGLEPWDNVIIKWWRNIASEGEQITIK